MGRDWIIEPINHPGGLYSRIIKKTHEMKVLH